jgi:hypothetical protein
MRDETTRSQVKADIAARVQLKLEQAEEFHLPGQHDQESHAGGRGNRFKVAISTDKELQDAEKKLTRTKELGGGRSVARVILGWTSDGRQIVTKTGLSKLHEDKEVLTSKLGIALGAPVPNVTNRRGGGVVMERAPGSAQGKWGQTPFRRILQPLRRDEIRDSLNAKGARELGILDYLSNQTDRRAANFLLDRKKSGNTVYGIDHTSSFWPQGRLQKKYPLSPFSAKYVRGKQFSSEEVDRIRKQVRSVRPYFARRKRLDWYDQVQRRVDSLATGYDLNTDRAGVQSSLTEVETFALSEGLVNIYSVDLEGNETQIGFFRVVGGKITQTDGSDFTAEFLLHIEDGSEALELYSDWSNGWISTRLA